MSRKSDAKKARRRKRQAERAVGWIPEPAHQELVESADFEHLLQDLDLDDADDEEELFADDLADDEEFSDVADAVADFDEWMNERGWVLDSEQCGEDVFTWIYPPSAVEAADGTTYPVTRTFIGIETDDDETVDIVLVLGVILVGMAEVDERLVGLQPEQLLGIIDAVEAYRPGMPQPAVG
jgi:hypothetical protein